MERRNILIFSNLIRKGKVKDNITRLEEGALNFFPGTGLRCPSNHTDVYDMVNLPYNLDDERWLAKMFQIDQKLADIPYEEVLSFVRNSDIFNEKKRQYERTIVRWQINYSLYSCDWNLNYLSNQNVKKFIFSPYCDVMYRDYIVSSMLKLKIPREIIEEELERDGDVWRDMYMKRAFWNSVSDDISKKQYLVNFLRLRRYEYYARYKDLVDKYGTISDGMEMSEAEAIAIAVYLDRELGTRFVRKHGKTIKRQKKINL